MLVFTALGNLSTGVATVGVFFLAESAHGFTTAENYQLGLVLGVTYALAAWKAGGILRRLSRHAGGLSGRAMLGLIAAALGLLCFLPYAIRERWAIYAFVALYAPLTGLFWPLVESYLSGGRRGEALRRAVGRFNVVWSSAMALAFWAVAPLVAEEPLTVFLCIAAIHGASLACLARFTPDPGGHAEEEHQAPASYAALLSAHRVLLVASYLVLFALGPYLPELLGDLGVPRAWQTPLASVWMVTRVATFWAMGRWQGWHGRGAVGAVGASLLVTGFGASMLAPLCPPGAALGVLVLGLGAFGVAAAALYTANLYYTLEVGETAVDAGGSHEGLIGLGYTLGPLCGWAVGRMAAHDLVPLDRSQEIVLVLIEALAIGAALAAWRVSRRAPKADAEGSIRARAARR